MHPAHLKPTPFLPYYPDGVVEWIDVFGFAVPLTWGDVAAEYNAIRTKAAAIEFSMLLKYDVEGRDAVSVVNQIFSRDVTKMSPGNIAYGVVVTEDGLMVDDCTVFLHSPTRVQVIGASEKLGKYLANYADAYTTVTERRDAFAQLSLQGPNSRKILQKLTTTDISNAAFPYYRFMTDVMVAGIAAQVNRLGFTGELGYEIMVAVDKAGELWAALHEAGKSEGLLPVGAAGLMTARMETGLIMGGLDYTEESTPFECRMGWAIDFNKASFQGRAALEKLKDRSRTKVVSVVLSVDEGEFSGCRLLLGNKDVGMIPMLVPSPVLGGKLLGLATIDADAAGVGRQLAIAGHPNIVGEIVRMPIYEADRQRVRS